MGCKFVHSVWISLTLARVRRWVFTLKAAEEEHLGEQLAALHDIYDSGQVNWIYASLEQGEQGGLQGYKHWQGGVHTKKRLRLTATKELFNEVAGGQGIHLEEQHGTNTQARSYPVPEYGDDWKIERGEPIAGDDEGGSRFERAIAIIDGGGSLADVLRGSGGFVPVNWVQELIAERDSTKVRNHTHVPVTKLWIGPHNTGKSTMARAWLDDKCGKDNWERLARESYQPRGLWKAKGILVDEVDSFPHELIGPLVRGEAILREIYGIPRPVQPLYIAFTSNYDTGEWWLGARAQETVQGTKSRISDISYTTRDPGTWLRFAAAGELGNNGSIRQGICERTQSRDSTSADGGARNDMARIHPGTENCDEGQYGLGHGVGGQVYAEENEVEEIIRVPEEREDDDIFEMINWS